MISTISNSSNNISLYFEDFSTLSALFIILLINLTRSIVGFVFITDIAVFLALADNLLAKTISSGSNG